MCRCRSNTYKAGTYIELNPGFVSGTDFVAEINPCSDAVTIIAAKTDDNEQMSRNNFEDNPSEDWLKIYPTILPSGNVITIESSTVVDGIELKLFDVQGRHVRSFRLNEFIQSSSVTIQIDVPAGLYIIKAQKKTKLFTQKIVIQ